MAAVSWTVLPTICGETEIGFPWKVNDGLTVKFDELGSMVVAEMTVIGELGGLLTMPVIFAPLRIVRVPLMTIWSEGPDPLTVSFSVVWGLILTLPLMVIAAGKLIAVGV